MMRKHKLAVTLFVIGLSIFAFPHVVQWINKHIHATEVEQFHRELESIPPSEITKTLDAVKQCNDSIFQNEDNVHDPFTEQYDRNEYKGCEEAPNNGDHFASIEIPKLDLMIPIYLGASDENLAKGVGQVDGSSLPIGGINTHTVLAGHRGMGTKAMFRHIDYLQNGDTFYIYTLNEKIEYQVYDTKVILPHETESLTIHEGKDLASLISCHPYPNNTHRLVVYGERMDNTE